MKSPSEKAFLQWGEKAQNDLSEYEKTGKLPEGMFEFSNDDNTEILKYFNDMHSSSLILDINTLKFTLESLCYNKTHIIESDNYRIIYKNLEYNKLLEILEKQSEYDSEAINIISWIEELNKKYKLVVPIMSPEKKNLFGGIETSNKFTIENILSYFKEKLK